MGSKLPMKIPHVVKLGSVNNDKLYHALSKIM